MRGRPAAPIHKPAELSGVGNPLAATAPHIRHSALKNIKAAIDGAPRNNYIAELHVQIIKYAHMLQNVTGKEFCEALGIGPASRGIRQNAEDRCPT